MTSTLVVLAAIALVAFTTEGAIGFGGTVIAASIGAQIVPIEELLPAFVPLNLLLSTWLLTRGLRSVAWRMLVVDVALPVGVGAAGGLALFHLPAKTVLALAFGVFVAGLATLQLARPADRPLARPWQLGMLVLGGVAHGLFGTGGPMIVYVLLINVLSLDLYRRHTLDLGLVLALVIVPGLYLGERIHHALDPARFERVVWVVLLVAGIALAVRNAVML